MSRAPDVPHRRLLLKGALAAGALAATPTVAQAAPRPKKAAPS